MRNIDNLVTNIATLMNIVGNQGSNDISIDEIKSYIANELEKVDAYLSDETFNVFNETDCSGHTTQKKSGNTMLTYLSWAWAWGEVLKYDPHATYEPLLFGDGVPYQRCGELGYLVWMRVTIKGETKVMWLPVLDTHNATMKDEPYSYQTSQGKQIDVDAITVYDINKALMRCLVKCIAMFGLGLYIYQKEDMPEGARKKKEQEEEDKQNQLHTIRQSIINEAKQYYIVEGKTDKKKQSEVFDVIKGICGSTNPNTITDIAIAEKALEAVSALNRKEN